MGYFARSPMRSVVKALETQVATMTAPLSIPAAARIAGWTKMI